MLDWLIDFEEGWLQVCGGLFQFLECWIGRRWWSSWFHVSIHNDWFMKLTQKYCNRLLQSSTVWIIMFNLLYNSLLPSWHHRFMVRTKMSAKTWDGSFFSAFDTFSDDENCFWNFDQFSVMLLTHRLCKLVYSELPLSNLALKFRKGRATATSMTGRAVALVSWSNRFSFIVLLLWLTQR